MAARIALSKATVTAPDGKVYDKVSVVGTNDDQVLVRTGPTVVLTLTEAVATRDTAATYQIVAAEGTYTVTIDRSSGCGCGR